jgi:phosphoribosylglycinamide formyltransferase-1
MTTPLRIAVLASGRGSNLAALLTARARGELAFDPVLVASDKETAGALRLADAAGIPTLALNPRSYAQRRDFDNALFSRVADSGAELIVLAGFMRIIDGDTLRPWVGRMINIHPSLLPKYRGLHTHRRALEAGDGEHGASVHYVTAELDGGPVIAQVRMAVTAQDDENTLAQRLLAQEHRLLPAVVDWIARKRLSLGESDRVLLDGVALTAPLRLHDGELQRSRDVFA